MSETYQLDLIWMTVLIFLPAAFALTLLYFPRGSEEYMRWWALAGTGAALGISLALVALYDAQVLERLGVTQDRAFRERAALTHRAAQLELESAPEAPEMPPIANAARSDDWLARRPWISQFNIFYYIGLDGISLSLIVLTTGLFFLTIAASWGITQFVRGYLGLMLLLETGLLGTFFALDLFLFYVFWEIVLLPMYFLIGIWGGPERVYAAIKFFLYTFFGSLLILLAIIGLYFTNVRDFVHPVVVETAIRRLADADPSPIPMAEKLEQARQRVVINTFDLIVLQRAGRAALQHLRGEPVTDVPAITAREETLAVAREKKPGDVAALERDLAEAKAGLAKRLGEEWFFQPWFQYTLFGLLFVGFAIKLPVVPLHTWLPAAHVEAPTPVSMILAGVLLKLGGYGLLRIAYPICPWPAEQLAFWIGLIAVISIVYGALVAMAQDDLKKLVAYSSVSHMGYVLLGLSVWTTADRAAYWSWGMNGALFLMLAHGVSSAGMFFLAGVIAERVKHRRLDLMGGLTEPMPITAGISAFVFFAAMGLPGLCSFIGEFMVVVGAWNANRVFALLALGTTLLTAGYILWTLQRVFLGPNTRFKDAPDTSPREMFVGVVLAALCVLLGVWPSLFLDWMEPSVTGLIDTLVRLPG